MVIAPEERAVLLVAGQLVQVAQGGGSGALEQARAGLRLAGQSLPTAPPPLSERDDAATG